MPHVIDVLAAGPWVLVLVFIVAGLDAVLPFMPSESSVVAAGVLAAATGRPNLGLLIASARYVPGGRSTTAFAAGLVRYPAARFHWYTGLGVLIWATQAALLGYLGGALFADRPLLGLALGCTGALAISGLVMAVGRLDHRSRATVTGRNDRTAADVLSEGVTQS